jgi:hypothetical protein
MMVFPYYVKLAYITSDLPSGSLLTARRWE